MAKTVYVTSAQKAAAKAIVSRDAARGRTTRSAVVTIANARSDKSGRFVVKSATHDAHS